ncbi:streptophobe family protein [Streptomyces antimicrobicus]|uniref:Streptophobe family protein n=1 Tax=Streptomyces antimicrobicus TaxID=2883108 RepID=A0ABS8B3W2_9ACTN|nr:streptophobe family protein [Streptomyces antimicrobicus]MCB5179267.1 streptophobe family protein [Streptomyces antimicrobicus]
MSGTAGSLLRAWRDAFVAVVAGFVAMAAVAAAGLACAGAGNLPDGAFPHVVAAVVAMAAGGAVEVTGEAGFLADARVDLSVVPLSVSLAGALATGLCFLRPLHNRAVATALELLARAVPVVVLWLLALTGSALLARHTFVLSLPPGLPSDSPPQDFGDLGDLGDLVGLGDLGDLADPRQVGDLLGVTPEVGFRADLAATLGFGLLWILGLLLIALLVSRRAPLPSALVRFHTALRPAAFSTAALLLACVAVAAVIGLVAAATRGHPADTFAVLLLGLPNLAWLALTVGFGGAWEGRVEGPFGLPVPHVLDQVLRTPGGLSTVDVASLARSDGPVWWWLVVAAAVLLFATGFLTAVRSPAGVPPWRHALHLAVALGLGVLAVCLLGRVHAQFGLSLLGLGDVPGLGGSVQLLPQLGRTVGLALLWGAVAGFLGALAAKPVHRRGEAGDAAGAPGRPAGPDRTT